MTTTATVTVLFTDVVGSGELRTTRGERSAQQLLETHAELVRREIERHNGEEIKALGDGFMVAFGSARSGVECAVAIQRALGEHARQHPEQQVQVRAGLNTGEAIHEGGDLFGSAVDAAARIMSKAAGGQILISEHTRGVIGKLQDVAVVNRGPFWLKGFPDRWRLYEILWQEEKAPLFSPPPHIAERTPFVGREIERAELRRFLEQARGGRGALVLVGGEPGVGKTRLCEELMIEARSHGFLTLTGHCYQMEGAPFYIPFVEAIELAARIVEPAALRLALGDSAPEVAKLMPRLRTLFRDIPPSAEMPPELERYYMFNGVRDFIERAAGVQPMLLIIEDLQWADDATLLLLQHVVQQVHEMPVYILGTYRDSELEVSISLARCLEELVRRRLDYRIALKPLPETNVMAMLRGRTGKEPPAAFVQAVFEETEGNPFFVEELFKHLAEEGKLFDAEGRWRADLRIDELNVPESVRLVVGHRLARVSDQCRRALTAGAIIGRGFGFELLGQVANLDEDTLLDAIDDAERAQLVTSKTERGQARISFAHDLIRHALVSSLSAPRRQRLHLRVADAMERLYADALEERAAAMAYHLSEAGAAADRIKTVTYLALAGDRALKASAFEDALRHYDDALSLEAGENLARRGSLLFKRGMARRSLGNWNEPLADWREALDVFERVNDRESVGHVCADLSYHFARYGRMKEAYEITQRGLAALGDTENADRCRLLGALGMVLSMMSGRTLDNANDCFKKALDIAEKLQSKPLLGSLLHRKAFHHIFHWQSKDTVEVGLEAARLLRPVGNLYDTSASLFVSQWGAVCSGRLEEAARIGAEAAALAAQSRNDTARCNALHCEALCGVAVTGNLQQFEKRVANQIESAKSAGVIWIVFEYGSLGRAQFWRGCWNEARETLRKGAESEPPVGTAIYGYCDGGLFLVTAYAGDKGAALALLEPKKEVLLGGLATPHTMRVVSAAVEGLVVLDEWSEASRFYPLALEATATGNIIRVSFDGLVQTTAGIAAMAGRQWDKAEEHYQTALRQAHEVPHKIEQPEVRRWYARMLIERNASGDKEKARALLSEAVQMYGTIGMPKHLEIAEELMKKL
ncbi:MAG: hypothetical protein C4520_11175 [Candidatus Abyssobacteria bacterium SURF_5]|uniref:Guanylate cyclase domain-containing protein n=1 Tax=Abyssobacteria bacterium (strain SURF_5) TaxID=2093360 RepID=A0A3A4NUD9_ABYX5|nr:MAG: hypothetical protein C4520_11175 [Candidatus Abyssubacteria bacterium SURF_5]